MGAESARAHSEKSTSKGRAKCMTTVECGGETLHDSGSADVHLLKIARKGEERTRRFAGARAAPHQLIYIARGFDK